MFHVFELKSQTKFSLDKFKQIIPSAWIVQEKDDKCLLKIPDTYENLDEVKRKLSRELLRIYFVANIEVNEDYCGWEKPDGTLIYISRGYCRVVVYGDIPTEIDKQDWNNENLSLQLYLWRLSFDENLPISSVIQFLYQIIETTPKELRDYKNNEFPPKPLAECKLLRDLVSHQEKEVSGKQLRLYCDYLKIEKKFYNPNNKELENILKSKIPMIREEVRKIIEQSISVIK